MQKIKQVWVNKSTNNNTFDSSKPNFCRSFPTSDFFPTNHNQQSEKVTTGEDLFFGRSFSFQAWFSGLQKFTGIKYF